MKARLRIIVAASAALLAAGAPSLVLAQEAPAEAQAPANDVIGPPQLQNFSINGTVTREAPAPAPVQQRVRSPATSESAPAQRPQTSTSRPSPQPRPTSSAESRPRPEPAEPGRDIALAAPVDDLTGADLADSSTEPLAPATTAAPAVDVAGGGPSLLPWIIAALALGAAAAWYFLRQRPREAYAGAEGGDLFDSLVAPAPKPAAAPPPAPAPRPEPAPSPGIVSTRLRPVLEIQFTPQRAVVDEEKAAVAFELSVYNSGSGPARDVLLEASLFNAGPAQDQQIRLFFENPVAKGDRVPLIAPMQRISVNTAVFLPRDQFRPIEVEGRPLLVPLIAFNVLYGWGSKSGQTSASYLIGKRTDGEKLAPFRLDLGPRVFRNLEAREHELHLRK